MASQSPRILMFSVAGSVALVALAVWLLRRPERTEAIVAPVGSQAQGALGVRAAGSDAARRNDPMAEDSPEPAEPVVLEVGRNGLREKKEESPAQPPEPPHVPTAEEIADGEARLAARDKATPQVVEALKAQHRAIRSACWTADKGASATFSVRPSFAADGTVVALSTSGDREAPPGVSDCIQAQLLALKIDPPGIGVMVDVPLTLP